MRKLGQHLHLPQTSRANPVKWHSTHNKDTLSRYVQARETARTLLFKRVLFLERERERLFSKSVLFCWILFFVVFFFWWYLFFCGIFFGGIFLRKKPCTVSSLQVDAQEEVLPAGCFFMQHTATRCNILHNTATHCNTLQHRSKQGITWQRKHSVFDANTFALHFGQAQSPSRGGGAPPPPLPPPPASRP